MQVVIGAIVGVLAIAALFTYFVYLPKRSELRQARESLVTEQERLRDAKEKAKEEETLDRRFAEVRRGLDYVGRRLPTKMVIQEVMDEVARASARSGIRATVFEPQKPASAAGVNDLAVRMTVRGTFHGYGTFLTELFAQPRVFTISDVQMDASAGPGVTLQVNFTLHAYYLDTAS